MMSLVQTLREVRFSDLDDEDPDDLLESMTQDPD